MSCQTLIVQSGTYAHKAWITGANSPSTSSENNNHIGYPTIQLQKTNRGSFASPCYITFWVWLDVDLQPSNLSSGGEDDWFSFATFTDDESDSWDKNRYEPEIALPKLILECTVHHKWLRGLFIMMI